MQLIGANPKPQISAIDALPGRVNYFRGNDPKQWRTNIPTYAKVKYDNVYPGIDLVYYGNQRQLEHDFVVAPGADPRKIRLNFAGAEKLAIDGQGDLVLKTAGRDVRLRKPRVYQDINGQRREIKGRYVLRAAKSHSKAQVGFQVAAYDKDKALIIDPVLVYATYMGGSNNDSGLGIAVDSAGNAYITGDTLSADFPMVNPVQGALAGTFDAFVAKLNAAGSALVYSTYLGGGGNGVDAGRGIAVDSAGNAYITGDTSSADFPTVNPVQGALVDGQDAFVAKLNAAGSALVYSTYLGGGNGADTGRGIAVDSVGNAYVVGYTNATSFPTVNPVQGALAGGRDAFMAKLNAGGSALVYSTYLGGSGDDLGFGIAVDSAGNAYITGDTLSADFPMVNPVQGALAGSFDAFVAKLNAAGSALVYSTYLGGGGNDFGLGIAVDSAGNAYITGDTYSASFPTVNPVQGALAGGGRDAFVAKLNAGGSALVYSTYLGGSDGEDGFGIAVDSAGNAYITGGTRSADFPMVNALQGSLAGVGDAFVAKFSDTAPPPPQPVLSVTPPLSSDFGQVTVGSSGDLTFTVTNTGAGTLTGTASTSAPFSIVSGSSFSLAAGASQAVVVRFTPTATGSFTGNVSFTSNGGNASQVVTGTGAAAPAQRYSYDTGLRQRRCRELG